MSLKINKLDKRYMQHALYLANQRIGLTGKNPSVGCVIVKNKEIISTGQTGLGGRPHAECVAIKNANKKKLKGSSMYVTLEPCNHYGITPPCTNNIIKSKIKKVYFGIEDPDKRVFGKSEKILQRKKIKVKKNVLFKEIKKLYESYFFLKKNKYPFVTGKIATTNNGYIKTKKKYISNIYSNSFTHLLRYKNHGILVTSKTVNDDNPFLNCRLNGLNKFSPKRIILDKNLIIKKNTNIIKSSNKIKTYIFHNVKNLKKKNFNYKNIKLIYVTLDENNNLDLLKILTKIRRMNIMYLLVEGGIKLTNNFLKNKLFNQFYLIKSNLKIPNSKNPKKYKILNNFARFFRHKEIVNTYTDKDIITRFYNV